MIRLMIHWPLSSVRLIAAMRNLAGLSGTMSFLLGGGKAASVMATKGSVFVDTSGWAYLVDRSAELHHSVHAVYQQIVAQRRLLFVLCHVLPLTNYALHLTFNISFGNSFALIVDRKSTRLNSSHSQISYAVF